MVVDSIALRIAKRRCEHAFCLIVVLIKDSNFGLEKATQWE